MFNILIIIIVDASLIRQPTTIKRKGIRGSPSQSPFCITNSLVGPPLTSTKTKQALRHSQIHPIHLASNPSL